MKNGKHISFVWNNKRQKVFDDIKKGMIITSIVTYSNFKKPFILYMNISGERIGVVLHQKDD